MGTQALATLIVVYGLFMPAIGWSWAGAVWVYALVWFLITDRVKLLTYKLIKSFPKHTRVPQAQRASA